jgi:hypothetical protein
MELSNNNYNPFNRDEGLDIPLYRRKSGRPSIELVGKGDKLVIDKDNKRWHIEGRFNPSVPPYYEAYCLFTPNKDKENPILLRGRVDGPKPELGLPFNPLIEGSLVELFEVLDWKSPIKNADPFTLSRRLDLAVKYKIDTQLNKARLKNLLDEPNKQQSLNAKNTKKVKKEQSKEKSPEQLRETGVKKNKDV